MNVQTSAACLAYLFAFLDLFADLFDSVRPKNTSAFSSPSIRIVEKNLRNQKLIWNMVKCSNKFNPNLNVGTNPLGFVVLVIKRIKNRFKFLTLLFYIYVRVNKFYWIYQLLVKLFLEQVAKFMMKFWI